MFVVMNLKKWNALPKDIQKVFEEVSKQWIDVHGKAWDDLDMDGRKYTLSLDNKIIPLTKAESARWKKAVRPMLVEYSQTTTAKAFPVRKPSWKQES